MLSMTLDRIDHVEIGKHPDCKRLMRALWFKNPPKPKLDLVWDPQVVLDYMSVIGDNEDLYLLALSRKLAMSLALTNILRVSELTAINFNSIYFSDT